MVTLGPMSGRSEWREDFDRDIREAKRHHRTAVVTAVIGAVGAILAASLALVSSYVNPPPAAAVSLPAERDRGTSYTVVVESVRLEANKALGLSWDLDSPPDPTVLVVNTMTERRATVGPVRDVFQATPNKDTIPVQAGDILEFTVYDADTVSGKDIAGRFTLVVTHDHLAHAETAWSFGRVEELRVRFRP